MYMTNLVIYGPLKLASVKCHVGRVSCTKYNINVRATYTMYHQYSTYLKHSPQAKMSTTWIAYSIKVKKKKKIKCLYSTKPYKEKVVVCWFNTL